MALAFTNYVTFHTNFLASQYDDNVDAEGQITAAANSWAVT